MITLKKKVTVELGVFVRSESRGQERMNVEINNVEVVFRGRSCMTEVSISAARHRPSSITNAIYALISDIEKEEAAELTRAIYEYVKNC
ncbi:hypothetical protein KNT70_gp059 [Cronobacter phage Pet-CM3-4]|uniref:Uncharacterized protein n=1 Tax=Cronobacter phage Pet-CM3-4 TaxID=1892569 RepID=A0A1D3RKH1_9CAUD|nr:hypothetical protein KNT70_gp059 [Cronobacter phage Pet-CM3-4]SCN45752.1 hypothetical protein [Cronobacter phage Pet-CM3-4]